MITKAPGRLPVLSVRTILTMDMTIEENIAVSRASRRSEWRNSCVLGRETWTRLVSRSRQTVVGSRETVLYTSMQKSWPVPKAWWAGTYLEKRR